MIPKHHDVLFLRWLFNCVSAGCYTAPSGQQLLGSGCMMAAHSPTSCVIAVRWVVWSDMMLYEFKCLWIQLFVCLWVESCGQGRAISVWNMSLFLVFPGRKGPA